MDAARVKDILTISDIKDLLDELGGDPVRKGNQIFSRTICHGGEKRKLTYIEDKKMFRCWTDCGCSYDIFSLIGKIYNMDFPSSYRYICSKFNINIDSNGLYGGEIVDTGFIKKFKKKEEEVIINELPKNILNTYYNLAHVEWLNDGISYDTMKNFNILYSIDMNKIIIPHFDINDRLIGVRGRALNQDEIDAGKKYMPVYHKKHGVLKHPTGGNLYGVNVNKEKIKECKKVILVESEKGVLQLQSMGFKVPGLGVSGSNLSDEQIKILLSLEVEEVIVAMDKEFSEFDTAEEKFYAQKVRSSILDKLLPYFRVSIVWDKEGLLDLKDSPTDKGLEVFNDLYNSRIFI